MSKDKILHTDGKWENAGIYIVANGQQIGQAFNIDFKVNKDCTVTSSDTGKINAERIVTCVNAMDGLSNEEVKYLLEYKKELIIALEMANSLLKSTYGAEFKEWIESVEIEKVLNKSKQTV
jgi:hypothetical protein